MNEEENTDKEKLFELKVIFNGQCSNHQPVYVYTDVDGMKNYKCANCPMGEVRKE